jgi:GNAT superfamily N-acetyltransferase
VRGARFVRLMAAIERKHPRTNHWYLPVLGVRPDRQASGLGSRLMCPVLERCDEHGLPAYLEASSPRNRALYERHGFAVTGELRLARSAPPVWLMWRAPRQPGV